MSNFHMATGFLMVHSTSWLVTEKILMTKYYDRSVTN